MDSLHTAEPQPTVTRDDGAAQLDMVQLLKKELGLLRFNDLAAKVPFTSRCVEACVLRLSCNCSQTNSVSFSSALHTAARHAHERSRGQELLEEVLEDALLSLLVQATQRHYLPVHTAARTGDRAALTAIMDRLFSVLARMKKPHLMQVSQAEQGAGHKCDNWTSRLHLLHASTHTGLLVCE
jgi:hypothetical protein